MKVLDRLLKKLANCSDRRIQQALTKEKNKDNNEQLNQFCFRATSQLF
jgi:hypothetical protein